MKLAQVHVAAIALLAAILCGCKAPPAASTTVAAPPATSVSAAAPSAASKETATTAAKSSAPADAPQPNGRLGEVKLVSKDGTEVHLRDAQILAVYVDDRGVWGDKCPFFVISDIIPPPGVKIQKQRVDFSAIRRLEWTKFESAEMHGVRGRVTFNDGNSKEVFLWSSDGNWLLGTASVEVVGTLVQDGKAVHATYNNGSLRIIEIIPSH